MTKELKNSIKLILAAVITAFAIVGVIHTLTFEDKMHEAFKNGYEQAILDAELTGVSENEYTISFNGEEHIYTKECSNTRMVGESINNPTTTGLPLLKPFRIW